MADANLIANIGAALDAHNQSVWEFTALVQYLNEPDDPPPLVLVLQRHADRLEQSAELLDTLHTQLRAQSGGMGAMAPMVTKVVDGQSIPSRA